MTDDKPVKKTPKKRKVEMQLLTALKFLSKAQVKGGDATQTHVRLADKMATAFNYVIAAGFPIVEDVNVVAHSEVLTKALAFFEKGDSITQQDAISLRLTMGDVVADVPCINPAAIVPVGPDPLFMHVADKVIKNAFIDLFKWVKAGAATIAEASVMLGTNSCMVTDLEAIVEYWHGLGLPYDMAVPQKAMSAIKMCKHDMIAVGYGEDRITFLYEGGIWLRTQTYKEEWPLKEAQHALHCVLKPEPFMPTFFSAVQRTLPYSDNDYIYFTKDGVAANRLGNGFGTVCAYPNLPDGVCINGKKLMLLKDKVHSAIWDDGNGKTYLYGEKVRAVFNHKAI